MESAAAEAGPVLEQGLVVESRKLCVDTTVLTIEVPRLEALTHPGQFVMLIPPVAGSDPFLPRPFSVHRLAGAGRLEVMIQEVGRGSSLLACMQPKQPLNLFGPLGRGFAVPESCRRVLLVGGGAGVAPLVFLAEQQARAGRQVTLFYGAAVACRLGEFPSLAALGVEVITVTEDGSVGRRGWVTEALEEYIGDAEVLDATYLAACGPMAMLERCAELARQKALFCQVSVESRMACGVGACLGCSIKAVNGRLLRVCQEGPVFDSVEVFGR